MRWTNHPAWFLVVVIVAGNCIVLGALALIAHFTDW